MRSMRRYLAALLLALSMAGLVPVMPARATVNSTVNKTIVLGNGTATVFNFNFVGVAAAYISVIYTDASGNETVLTQGAGATQYQITLNAPVTGAIWGLGGTVTYNPSGTPIPNGSTLTIFRTLPLTQAISLQNQNSLARLGNGAETGLDTGVMQAQQISETIARAIKAPIVDATPPADLPPIAQRANQGAAFDAQGNLVAGAMPGSGVISSAMQPVVNAATLALARAALGLGNAAVENIGCGLQDDGASNLRVNSALTSVASNQAVDATFCARTFIATGPINFTLARANTLWNGFAFSLVTISGPVTLVPNANDSVQGQGTGASVTIPANSYARITTDGAGAGSWRIDWSGPATAGSLVDQVIANNTGTPNTKIDVTIAAVTATSAANLGASFANAAFTIDLTTGTSSSTPNGMDGEAVPSSGDLFIWAISDGNTIVGLASTSSTAPTLPTSYSFKRYIGAMKTAGSILKRTRQVGRYTQYVITAGSNTPQPPVLGNGVAGIYDSSGPVLATASVTGVVPATASEIVILASNHRQNLASASVIVAPSGAYSGGGNGPYGTNGVLWPIDLISTSPQSAQATLLLESTTLAWASSAAGGAIACLGWIDGKL